MSLIELSHEIVDGTITYRGLPAPCVSDFISHKDSGKHYDNQASFHIGKIEMVFNTGTYIDSPFHRYPDREDISQIGLDRVANIPGLVVFPSKGKRAIGKENFTNEEISGKAVLVCTGWSRHWGTDHYFDGHPHLTEEAANFLKEQGALLVGIDSLNIDDTQDPRRPVHTTLLEAGIPIVEHLCDVERLPKSGFHFFAAPIRVLGAGSFPVRAFAIVN